MIASTGRGHQELVAIWNRGTMETSQTMAGDESGSLFSYRLVIDGREAETSRKRGVHCGRGNEFGVGGGDCVDCCALPCLALRLGREITGFCLVLVSNVEMKEMVVKEECRVCEGLA